MNNIAKYNKISKYGLHNHTYNLDSKCNEYNKFKDAVDSYDNENYNVYCTMSVFRCSTSKFSQSIIMPNESLSNMMTIKDDVGLTKFSSCVHNGMWNNNTNVDYNEFSKEQLNLYGIEPRITYIY